MLKKAFFITAATLSILWLSIEFLLRISITCENDIFKILPSPDKQKAIIVFSRTCGATTGFNTQLLLTTDVDSAPTGTGNILRIAGSPEENALNIHWQDNQTLTIKGVEAQQIYAQEKRVMDVSIIYRSD